MEGYWKDNLPTLYTGTRLDVSNLEFPSTERASLSHFSKETIVERKESVETYGTLQRQVIVDGATAVRLLCKLRQHASQTSRAASEFLAEVGNTSYSLSDLDQLEMIHKAKAIAGSVKIGFCHEGKKQHHTKTSREYGNLKGVKKTLALADKVNSLSVNHSPTLK